MTSLARHQACSSGALFLSAVLLLSAGGARDALAQGAPAPPAAQNPPAPQAATPAPRGVEDDRANAHDVRNTLNEVLRQYPPTLRDVLRLDPTLLNDEAYLASYPALRTVLSRYPQIARNPSFYVGESPEHQPTDTRSQAINMWRNTFESISMLSVMLLVAVGLAWLVRTVLDHRRWLRTSRVQTEVQHKLFDRLSTNEDLLTYIQTPAGQRLLDASPGMQDPGPRSVTAPVNRILWSVQIGMVLIPFGLGLQWVGRHLLEEVAQFLWFVGVMAVTIGIGFVISAATAYLISRRLGLIREPLSVAATPRTEPLA